MAKWNFILGKDLVECGNWQKVGKDLSSIFTWKVPSCTCSGRNVHTNKALDKQNRFYLPLLFHLKLYSLSNACAPHVESRHQDGWSGASVVWLDNTTRGQTTVTRDCFEILYSCLAALENTIQYGQRTEGDCIIHQEKKHLFSFDLFKPFTVSLNY